jgi:hypothetical protein
MYRAGSGAAASSAASRPHAAAATLLWAPQEQSFVEAAFAKNGTLVAQYWLGLARNGTAATSSFYSVWEPARALVANIYSDAPYYAHWCALGFASRQ